MSLTSRMRAALLLAILGAAWLGSMSWLAFGSSSPVFVAGILAGFMMGGIAGWATFAPPPCSPRNK